MKGLLMNKERGKLFDFMLKPRKYFELTAFTDGTSKKGGLGGIKDAENSPFSPSRLL